MKPTDRQLTAALRRTLWTGGSLILVMLLSLVVCALLALVGDRVGRAAAMVVTLISFLALILDLCVAVGILSSIAVRDRERTAAPDHPEFDREE